MRANRLAGGLVILLIGLMFLLANMGVLDLSVWALVFRFWPVLLIVGGLTLLVGGGFRWFLVVLLAAVIAAGTFGGPVVWGWATGPLTTETFVPQAATAATALEVEVDMSAPSLRVLPPTEEAYRLELGYRAARPPEVSYEDSATTGKLSIRQEAHSNTVVPGGPGLRQNLALGFSAALPLDLLFDSGASSADLDLRQYQVRSLRYHAGAGHLKLRLGQPQGPMTVDADTGAGNIEIWVPEGVGVRVVASIGVGPKQLTGAGLHRSGDTWQDDRYESATDRIEIRVSAGVGRLALTRY